MSEPTSTVCGCYTMRHPQRGEWRLSDDDEAYHVQKHIEWNRFKEKHEAECPKLSEVKNGNPSSL